MSQQEIQNYLRECTHVVIKLGTNILTPHIETLDSNYFYRLGEQIQKLIAMNKKVLVVSSGAVGFGKRILKETDRNKTYTIAQKQAFASLGQSLLIDTYRDSFQKTGLETGQILVTPSDFLSRTHYKNLKQTLDQLMEWGAVPVINENDAITVEGLKFGDNDTLSAFIAGMYPQSCLIILTTIDGFYYNGSKVGLITRITEEYEEAAGAPDSGGIGGMRTKLHAAKKILLSGQVMNIASGQNPEILEDIIQAKQTGTWFYPETADSLSFRKRWLLHHRHILGKIKIDEGAAKALKATSASLLLVGVSSIDGNFAKGAVIEIIGADNEPLGRGIAAYPASELCQKMEQTDKRGLFAVHRDNLVLYKE